MSALPALPRGASFVLGCARAWGAWTAEWTVDCPVPARCAPFRPSCFWTMGRLGVSLATFRGSFAGGVAREARRARCTVLPSPALH